MFFLSDRVLSRVYTKIINAWKVTRSMLGKVIQLAASAMTKSWSPRMFLITGKHWLNLQS
jgi:hypothetical protein